MKRSHAFTMIELLTVIAIIAILAAILFPVYSRVKDSAYRSSDTSNMNAIRTALQLYKTDQGAYPPQLLGYVTLYTSGPLIGQVVPVNQLVGALYSKRVDAIDTFRPANLRGTDQVLTTETTPAGGTTGVVWPTVMAGDYAGGGGIVASCAVPAVQCSLQAYAPADGFVTILPSGQLSAASVGGTPVDYYTISGYDTALVKTTAGQQRELRYSLFWSAYGLGAGSAQDSLRQLGYSEPPESTVITWDSYFRDYRPDGSVAPGEKREIVLYLGGAARPHDSVDVFNQAWQTGP
ncbi:MAG TPA: type II secretion system protein [Fimbriimonadaceae bacterium]|nr:type II secretion system protein [Fimbriimonadaceae bacterium]